MSKIALLVTALLALAGTGAIAATGESENGEPEQRQASSSPAHECAGERSISEAAKAEGSDFGECVSSTASNRGKEKSENAGKSADKGKGDKKGRANGEQEENGGERGGERNPTNRVAGVTPQDGREFGQAVAAEASKGRSAERGQGAGSGPRSGNGNAGTRGGQRNPTNGVGSSPQSGREFGRSVAGTARGENGPPAGRGRGAR